MVMVKNLIFVGLILFGLLGCAQESGNSKYRLLGGETIDLAASPKLIFINYWAVWCAPCRKEIPEFNEFSHQFGDRVTVLGVNFDNSQGDILRTEMIKLGIEFPALLADPRAMWGLEPVAVLPETLVIGTDGKLLHRMIGPQTMDALKALL
jgi:thiol-disulfide isomerase/thioredoxin